MCTMPVACERDYSVRVLNVAAFRDKIFPESEAKSLCRRFICCFIRQVLIDDFIYCSSGIHQSVAVVPLPDEKFSRFFSLGLGVKVLVELPYKR